jgi:predicted lipase
LGAALATVAAIEIHNKLRPVAELHTYGSPRVGNADLAMYIKTKIPNSLRVVHYKDIVPHVPLQSQNYHHIPY